MHIENQPDEDFILNLERLSPDLYAFQEVSLYSEAILTQNLSDRYPYHQYNSSEGLAIYSRYPIGDGISPSGGDSPFQSVTILVDGNSIHLVNSHLAQTRLLQFMATGNAGFIREAVALRSAQIDEILDDAVQEILHDLIMNEARGRVAEKMCWLCRRDSRHKSE